MPDLENLIARELTHCTALGAIRRVLLISTITAWRSAIAIDMQQLLMCAKFSPAHFTLFHLMHMRSQRLHYRPRWFI